MLRIGGQLLKGPYLPQTTAGLSRTTRAIFGRLKPDQLKGASCRRFSGCRTSTAAIDATTFAHRNSGGSPSFPQGAVFEFGVAASSHRVQPEAAFFSWGTEAGIRGLRDPHRHEPLGRGGIADDQPRLGWRPEIEAVRPVADPARGPPRPLLALLRALPPAAGSRSHPSTGGQRALRRGGCLRPRPWAAAVSCRQLAPSNRQCRRPDAAQARGTPRAPGGPITRFPERQSGLGQGHSAIPARFKPTGPAARFFLQRAPGKPAAASRGECRCRPSHRG